ncbi:MAG: cytochrome c maturation protein CcmE [Myxococcota bacterium]
MTDTTKKRLFAVAAIGIALGALGVISMGGIGENLVYYWTPTELLTNDKAEDAVVRLGGMVVAGTMNWDRETQVVTFDLTDGERTVKVRNEGNPPQMFREGIGAVVEGKLTSDGVFHSDKVMVKHDNQYKAPDGKVPTVEEMKQMAESMAKETP